MLFSLKNNMLYVSYLDKNNFSFVYVYTCKILCVNYIYNPEKQVKSFLL